ncbi:hypothetical protein RRF57_004535 [Xylaria bambusicola]|uniref:Uncharacterized protein n=1 Tax=Xylaria bambusicola TaxID=326684 RepID=A0AAN7YX46_9PEZI
MAELSWRTNLNPRTRETNDVKRRRSCEAVWTLFLRYDTLVHGGHVVVSPCVTPFVLRPRGLDLGPGAHSPTVLDSN